MDFRLQKKTSLMLVLMVLALTVASCTTQPQKQETQEDTTTADDTTTEPAEEDTQAEETETAEQAESGVKTFVLTGENFFFEMDGERNPDIVVNQGDTVRIEFTSTDGFHDWTVDEFDAATERVQTGGSTTVEFVADQKGTFEYYCSVGSHRANGMFGSLIVE